MDKTFAHICKNCEIPIQGNYCANCGQKTSITKITFKETFQDIIAMFFSVNAPLLLTLKLTFLNPGKLFREFIAGKRKTYYKPVPFFILMTVLYVIIRTILNYNPMDGVDLKEFSDSEKVNLSMESGRFMAKNITNFLFFFVFTLGISMKLFFRKKYTLAEYIAIAFYLIGVYTFMVSLLMFCFTYIPMKWHWKPLSLMLMLLYFIYAFVSLFQDATFKTIIKGFFTYILAIVCFVVLSFGLSILMILFFK